MTAKLLLIALALLVLADVARSSAAECELKQASFRPRYGPDRFLLRGFEEEGQLRFELSFLQTGARYLFRIEREAQGKGMRLHSLPLPGLPDGAIKAEFRMSNSAHAVVQDGPVRSLSFIDLARSFLHLEAIKESGSESPPSGLWLLSECRS